MIHKNPIGMFIPSVLILKMFLNHPSGDPEPSEADVETTVRLMEAGAILGIPVLDHIVIGDGNYVSMKARGMI